MCAQEILERLFGFLIARIREKHHHEQRDLAFLELPEMAGEEAETMGESHAVLVAASPAHEANRVFFGVAKNRQRASVSRMAETREHWRIEGGIHTAQHFDCNGELKGGWLRQIHISCLLVWAEGVAGG